MNMTFFCARMESYGAPSYAARKNGQVAVELEDVNTDAVLLELINTIGVEAVLDGIPSQDLVKYMERLGFVLRTEA